MTGKSRLLVCSFWRCRRAPWRKWARQPPHRPRSPRQRTHSSGYRGDTVIEKGTQGEEVGARGRMGPRAQRLERKRRPRVVAGDAWRQSGSFARLNASARAGANLIDRSRSDLMRQPLRVRIVKMRAVPVGPEWIQLSARSRRANGFRLLSGHSMLCPYWLPTRLAVWPSGRLAVWPSGRLAVFD